MKYLAIFLALILGITNIKSQGYKIAIVRYYTNLGEVFDPTIHKNYTPINIHHHNMVFVNTQLAMLFKDNDDVVSLYIDVFDSKGNSRRLVSFEGIVKRTHNSFTPVINYDDIDFGNGNYIIARLFSNGAELARSEKIPIKKSPRFTVSSTSLDVFCHTKNLKISCNANTNVGTFKYRWKIGNGWKDDNGNNLPTDIQSTDNSISLSPINPKYIPSEISVTPIWNNKPQPSIKIVINKKDIPKVGVIEGKSVFCNAMGQIQEYTITNIRSDDKVEWQSSDPSALEIISSHNHRTVTVSIKSDKGGIITANISNPCGENYSISKTIWIGKPKVKVKVLPYERGAKLWIESAVDGVSLMDQNTNIHWKNHTTGSVSDGWIYITPVNGDTMERVEATISNSCGKEKIEKWVARTCENNNPYLLANTYTDHYTLTPIRPCVEPGFYEYSRTTYSTLSTDGISIQISDIRGNILLTTKNKEFSLSHLLPGTYYARVIKNGKVVHTQTLLKQ